MADRKSINRATLLLVIVIFSALWIMVNAQKILIAGIIFLAIPITSIFLYRQWEFLIKGARLEGINSKWFKHSLVGLAVVTVIIILDKFVPGVIAIGIPPVQSIADNLGKILVLLIMAPISEEIFFRELFHDFFESRVGLSFFISALISSSAFALFHLNVYGGSLISAQGSFITAMMAGMIFSYINKLTGDNAGNITAHAVFNFYIGFVKLSLI